MHSGDSTAGGFDPAFYESALDAFTANVAVLDAWGEIVAVNDAWRLEFLKGHLSLRNAEPGLALEAWAPFLPEGED